MRRQSEDELVVDKPTGFPVFPEALPPREIEEGNYRVSFARKPEELEAAQRLRFEVFNLELGEGLEESYASGLDRDRFDPVCHHLLVTHLPTGQVVGTYRMQTSAMAERYGGFYSADEFTLDRLPPEVTGNAVEVGRACVGREFRNRHVLFQLWKGLAAYLTHTRKRYLFGCCSLTSQDPVEGKHVMDFLTGRGCVDARHGVRPQPGWECYPEGYRPEPAEPASEVRLPKLFNLYMRIGAKVCGEPAIDRLFKTIDYFVLFDLDDLDAQRREMFFGRE